MIQIFKFKMGRLHENYLPYNKVRFFTKWFPLFDVGGRGLHLYHCDLWILIFSGFFPMEFSLIKHVRVPRWSVSMVGTHHPWTEPGRRKLGKAAGLCGRYPCQKIFVKCHHLLYPDLYLMDHGICGVSFLNFWCSHEKVLFPPARGKFSRDELLGKRGNSMSSWIP